ncbi:preprotein translocase subunit YajC [Microbacterium sp. CFBP9034]|uniref:preprotein translocase subunit YajC n=1 Tax=Microbacterium sp. CFBP9034 TaxID=3096540 RepID=UPI002A6AAE32|nr:preprotein translocase subunit YajC [Microbacterium sp. CFBP9034]MDY0909755.1 preprotein translocase subunit YajC [Microbacterium sp. CFBP9034]
MSDFFANYGLIILLVVLLVFMFWSSRRRMAKQKLEQEQRARQTVPGAEVMLQGGLYGTIVSYDPDNLDQPAIVELAPGVEIKVHSQAILRVVAPTDDVVVTEDDYLPETTAPADDVVVVEEISPVVDDTRTTGDTVDPGTEPGTKPQA